MNTTIAYFELKKLMQSYGDLPSYQMPEILQKSATYCSKRLGGRSGLSFTLEDAYKVLDYYEIPYSKLAFYFPKGGKRIAYDDLDYAA